MSTKAEIKKELGTLVSRGHQLKELLRKTAPAEALEFAGEYQGWYTEALAVMKALVPERLAEFRDCYERDRKRKDFDVVSYTLQDFTQGVAPSTYPQLDVVSIAYAKLSAQVDILESALARLDSILADIRGALQASLFDSEIEEAKHLVANGHIRAAGAVCGVVLEEHLSEVCGRHSVAVRKKNPTIGDYAEYLKSAGVLDVPQWRGLQHLADIRNLCDHKKTREPTKEEVEELVSGVAKATKVIH